MLDALTGHAAVQAIAQALIAFVWQGAIAGCLVAAVMIALRASTPHVRYIVGVVGLAAMATLPAIEFFRALPAALVTGAWIDRQVAAIDASTASVPADVPLANLTAPPSAGGLFEAIVVLAWACGVATLTVSLLRSWRQGRVFTDRDRDGAPRVAIINDAFARLHYPNEDPIGKQIRMGRNSSIVREIVGVVGAVKHYDLTDDAGQAQMYEPFRQMPYTGMTFVLHSAQDPAAIGAAVRREIRALDADQPVVSVRPVDAMIADSSALPRVQMVLLGGFAAIALLIASVGLYGVMAYTVSQRTQEIGVRMALGAHRPAVLMMVLRQGMGLVAIGLVIGIGGALVLGRVMSSVLEPMLFEVRPSDSVTFAIVLCVLTAVGVLASLLPARRATRIDPIQALRNT